MEIARTVRDGISRAIQGLGDLRTEAQIHIQTSGMSIDPATMEPVAATIDSLTNNIDLMIYNIDSLGATVIIVETDTVRGVILTDDHEIITERMIGTTVDQSTLKAFRTVKMVVRQEEVSNEPTLFDYVTLKNREWWITGVNRDMVDATYILKLRQK